MPLPKREEDRYTYADLLTWDESERYELHGGRPVAMASPSLAHQIVSRELLWQIASFLRGKPCEVFSAPLDVRLFERDGDAPEDVDTVLQPDLLVVCDRKKLDRRGVHGAPDMVIEILSPSTHFVDWRKKPELYQAAGVREYWVCDPEWGRFVAVHILRDGKYDVPTFYTAPASVPVSLWDGFSVDLSTVFPEKETE